MGGGPCRKPRRQGQNRLLRQSGRTHTRGLSRVGAGHPRGDASGPKGCLETASRSSRSSTFPAASLDGIRESGKRPPSSLFHSSIINRKNRWVLSTVIERFTRIRSKQVQTRLTLPRIFIEWCKTITTDILEVPLTSFKNYSDHSIKWGVSDIIFSISLLSVLGQDRLTSRASNLKPTKSIQKYNQTCVGQWSKNFELIMI